MTEKYKINIFLGEIGERGDLLMPLDGYRHYARAIMRHAEFDSYDDAFSALTYFLLLYLTTTNWQYEEDRRMVFPKSPGSPHCIAEIYQGQQRRRDN